MGGWGKKKCPCQTLCLFLKLRYFSDISIKESAKSLGLPDNVGYVGAWVTWFQLLRGLRGLRWSKYFFTWVIIFTWVAWVKCIFVWVFAWVKNFCLSQFLGGSPKKNLDWHFHNKILVAD